MIFNRLSDLGVLTLCIFLYGSVVAEVDGITAATVNNQCRFVLPIETSSTTATIKWTEEHVGGTGDLCYGIDSPSNCQKVSATERVDKTILLTGLLPSTTYQIRIEFTKPGELPYAAVATLTTKAPSAAGLPRHTTAERQTYTVGGSGIVAPGEARPGEVLAVMDQQGRLVGEISVGSDSTHGLARLSEGIFVVILRRDGSTVGARTLHVRKRSP
jgi:hypothetical protein